MDFLFAVGLAGIAIWAISYILRSQPLKDHQLEELATCRRLEKIRRFCNFSTVRREADLNFKQAMKADGQFHNVNYPLSESLSVIASHLKSKKHEWVVFAIVVHGRVISLWCNKGPNAKMVWPKVSSTHLISTTKLLHSQFVIRLHNHPNSRGKRQSLLGPSEQDLRSFQHFAEIFGSHGINFLDVVCERGYWLVYGEYYVDAWFPLEEENAAVRALNRTTWQTHRRLRRELAHLRGKSTDRAAQ